MIKRGAFICLEGVDHSGKTTHSLLLSEYLKEKDIANEVVRFPMRATHIGQLLNSYLKQDLNLTKETAHLLFSANRWEAKYYIDDLLDQGITVIADRYSYSGIAYSMASGLDPEWCRSSEVGLPEPDLVIYFDVDIEQSYNDFVGSGGDVQERNDEVDFLAKVHNAYQCIPLMSVPWFFIDASGTKETTRDMIKGLAIDAIRKTNERHYIHWSI